MSSHVFYEFLAQQKLIILDGALATELEARGLDLNDPSWSAKALLGEVSIVFLVTPIHQNTLKSQGRLSSAKANVADNSAKNH